MIFIDSNIPMYLIGADHAHKVDAQRQLEQQVAAGQRLVTDVEVLQEILHRYVAIGRRDAIQPAFDALLGVVDEVFVIDRQDVERARDILHGNVVLSARDALHTAVMQRHGVSRILTFDRAFSNLPGIERVL
jgi:hypothetical protein